MLLLVAGTAGADPPALLERAPESPLAERLAGQLERLRAEDARRARDRKLDRLREEGRLSHIGTPEELELYRLRARATLRRDRDVEELELSRLASSPSRGARAELEATRHRLDLERSIDRVVEQVEHGRRLYHLERTLARKRAADLRLQRPRALRSGSWSVGGLRSSGSGGLDLR